ncbi:hypothetical protein MMC10_004649 [Thelotrema lepadinum]|nr:hypothetical protein [Thelotrema lepadinum]
MAQSQKLFPGRQDILEFRTVTQLLALFDSSKASLSSKVRDSLYSSSTRLPSTHPTDQAFSEFTKAFIYLLVRGNEAIAALPGYPPQVDLTWSSNTNATHLTAQSGMQKVKISNTIYSPSSAPASKLPDLRHWFMDRSNYVSMPDVNSKRENDMLAQISFDAHVGLVTELVRRMTSSPKLDDRLAWCKKLGRYLGVECVFKVQKRIKLGMHVTKPSNLPKKPMGRNLWLYLTTTPAQLGFNAQKDHTDLRLWPLPEDVRYVYGELGILPKDDKRDYKIYDLEGKERLGLALNALLKAIWNHTNLTCAAATAFKKVVLSSDETARQETYEALQATVTKFIETMWMLDMLLKACVIPRSLGRRKDVVLEYLFWIEKTQDLQRTTNKYPESAFDNSTTKQPEPSHDSPPDQTTTRVCQKQEEEQHNLNTKDDDSEYLQDQGEVPMSWAGSARKWLSLIIRHWRAIFAFASPPSSPHLKKRLQRC